MEIIVFEPAKQPVLVKQLDALPENGFIWININRETHQNWVEQCQAIVGCNFNIHEYHIKDSLNATHPPHFSGMKHYDMLVLHSFIQEKPSFQAETCPILFFLSAKCLVSVYSPKSNLTQKVKKKLFERQSHHQPDEPVELLYFLVNMLTDDFLLLREPSAQGETWRNLLLDRRFQNWESLLENRLKLRYFSNLCEQHLNILEEWRNDTNYQIDEDTAIHFNDIEEHFERVLRHIERLQSEMDFLIQLNFSAMTQRSNRIVEMLTTVSVIFLPLNLIAGIFGMNFSVIPFQAEPFGFYGTVLSLCGFGFGLFFFLKWKKWI